MHDREDVELALLALGEGMSLRGAARLVGCSKTTVREWAAAGPRTRGRGVESSPGRRRPGRWAP